MHAVQRPAGKVMWLFVPGSFWTGSKTLKLSVVNLNFDVIFIMFKATTGNAVEDYEYNANK